MKQLKIDNERIYDLKEVEVNAEDLFFNPYNARIFSISQKIINDIKNDNGIPSDEEVSIDLLIREESQDLIYEGFTNMYFKNKDYSALRKSIVKTKGLDPEKIIYITNKNVVLSGNTRLSILKTLQQGENIKGISFKVKAYRIQQDVNSQEDIDILENYLQYNLEEKVPYENFQLWMKIHSMYRGGENITFKNLSEKFNLEEDMIEKHIYTINQYYETLGKLGNNNYIELYKHLHMSSVMQYIAHDLNGKNPKYTREIRDEVEAFAIDSILSDFNWNKIRKVSNTYLGIKSSKFDNSDKIEAIKKIRKEMREESGDAIDFTKKLIIQGKDIMNSKERKERISNYDPSSIISKMQTEADKEKSSLEKNQTELTKNEVKTIEKSIKKIIKLNPKFDNELNDKYGELEEILNKIIENGKY